MSLSAQWYNYMFFVYLLLSISMYSLQRQKPQVEISPIEKIEVVKSKPKKVEPIISEFEQMDWESEEENLIDIDDNEINIEWEDEEDFDNEELYEEIIFQDNFDKEYREDVGDNYFEEPENIEDSQEINDSDSIENMENIENIEE